MKTAKPIRMPLRRAPKRARPSSTAPLRARAATADETYDEEEDYEGETEPNMKLSHAFIVVLVLHIIAVGGILGFNTIKDRQKAESKAAKTQVVPEIPRTGDGSEATESATTASIAAPAADKPSSTATGKVHAIAAGDTLSHIAAQYGVTIDAIEKENNITSSTLLRVGYPLKIPAASAKTPVKSIATTKPEPAKAVESTPAKSAAVEKTPEKAPSSSATTSDAEVYVVAKGDNPYSIAKKLHVSYNELISLNEIKDPTKIQIGQKLKIPKKN